MPLNHCKAKADAMAYRSGWTRRQALLAGGAGLVAGVVPFRPALAQISDLRGFDPLWRDAEHAIQMFFGNVEFRNEGLHIDLPQHADVGNSVPMTIRLDSAMTEEDCPEVIHILSHGNPTPHIMSAWMTPRAGRAEYSTRIRLEQSQTVTAVAKMRDGRHLRVDRDISVSFGACAQIGTGGADYVFGFQPEPRVRVPGTASPGDIVPVRAAITHPMETGLRTDSTDDWIRQRIISRFDCKLNGEEVFRARLYPAIATNPYLAFFARIEDGGTFRFSWYDTTDVTYTAEASIGIS
jgi:sulfur-oxidizing protein SoxY